MIDYSEVKDFLVAAKALIDRPDKWCQLDYGKNENGEVVDLIEPACRMCALGALKKQAGAATFWEELTGTGLEARYVLAKIIEETGTSHAIVSQFNDTHTHAEVMQLWDEAIARAGELSA